MKLFFFRCLAKFLVAHPRITDWLYERAKRNPYMHLGGYMSRDWVCPLPPCADDTHSFPGEFPVLTHIAHFFGLYVRFHMIHRRDYDRHLHNHPFDFTSLILRGHYLQYVELPDGSGHHQFFGPGDVNVMRAGREWTDYHHIAEVSDGGVLTLVFHGPKNPESWGFLVDGEHVYYKNYHGFMPQGVPQTEQQATGDKP